MLGNGWKSSARRHLWTEFPVPEWIPSSVQKHIPHKRLKFCSGPTPIHPWLTLENDREVFIKRDDQTAAGLSGNKIRKLEFIMTDLLNKGCDTVITCGALQSNHCRAVSIIAAELGIECHLLLRTAFSDVSDTPLTGNFLLDNLTGSFSYLVGAKEPYATGLLPRAQKLAEVLKRDMGRNSYIIPVGGSDMVGVFGYLVAFDEILQQCPSSVRNIFVACGSGGTLAGLAIANHLSGNKFRICGITVCDNKQYFLDHVQKMLNDLELTSVVASNICHVIDGYKGTGYGVSTQHGRDFITKMASETGIILDPVYTGKACHGMLTELECQADVYDGNSLFIHTGGIFGLFGDIGFSNSEASGSGDSDESKLRKVTVWKDSNQEPFIFV